MNTPDYDHSIVNLISSLAAANGIDSDFYPPLEQLDRYRLSGRPVVLMVIDGMGYQYLSQRPDSRLYSALAGRLTSVFPTTTATAVSALALGVSAQQHSITGWFTYLKELGCVAAPLPFVPRGGGSFSRCGTQAKELLDWPALLPRFQAPVSVVLPQYIAQSSYTTALFESLQRKPFDDLDSYFSQLTEAVFEPGNPFVWGYWTELDAMAHSCGINSPEVEAHFQNIDQGFGRFMDSIAGTDAIVIVTADHGLIDTAQDRIVHMHQHPELQQMLLLPLCGEPRAAYCYLRPGSERDFDRYISEQLDACLQVFDTDELVAQGWFGRGALAPRFKERIGDRLLLPRSNWIVKDRLLQESAFDQIGVHGGLSDDELYVPMIVAES
ncbi:MAG: alkaline phosphatase family protein [Motiliproteus sp.]